MQKRFAIPLFGCVVSAALLQGCSVLPPEYQRYATQLAKEAITVVFGSSSGRLSPAEGAVSPSPLVSPTGEYLSENANRSKANAELLHEMHQVIFLREPRDRGEFGSYVDTLNQGASFEGVYNGLTHSSDYRQLEASNEAASAEALKAFSEELAELEAELPVMTFFNDKSAQPVIIGQPGVDPRVRSEPSSFGSVPYDGGAAPSPRPSVDKKSLADNYAKIFVTASVFTLKRVLSDEAMKVVGSKREYREKLALWYAKWVVRLCDRKINFGLPLRNKADEQFHFKWALQATDDRLHWEVLNRLHRVLNEANRQKP